MACRAAKFILAIFASLVMSAPLTTMSYGAPAADTCLFAPKDTPPGYRWYYYTDHDTNRQCWFLKEESDKISQSEKQSEKRRAAPSIKHRIKPAASRSLANAHAEAPMPPQSATEQETAANVAPAASTNQVASADGDGVQETIVAARWPAPGTSTTTIFVPQQPTPSEIASPQPAAPVAVAEAPSQQQAPASSAAAVPMTLAAADLPTKKPTSSIPKLLLVMLSALAMAGLIGSIVSIYGLVRRRYPLSNRVHSGGRRRVNWEPTSNGSRLAPWAEETSSPALWAEETPPSEFARTSERPAEPQQAEARHVADDAIDVDEVTEMLERFIKKGPKLSRPISAAASASYGRS